ncbi:hypothetical protein ACOME3_002173 [Neoechinorhynchus agilis]
MQILEMVDQSQQDAPMGTMLPRSYKGLTIKHYIPNFTPNATLDPLDIVFAVNSKRDPVTYWKQKKAEVDEIKRRISQKRVQRKTTIDRSSVFEQIGKTEETKKSATNERLSEQFQKNSVAEDEKKEAKEEVIRPGFGYLDSDYVLLTSVVKAFIQNHPEYRDFPTNSLPQVDYSATNLHLCLSSRQIQKVIERRRPIEKWIQPPVSEQCSEPLQLFKFGLEQLDLENDEVDAPIRLTQCAPKECKRNEFISNSYHSFDEFETRRSLQPKGKMQEIANVPPKTIIHLKSALTMHPNEYPFPTHTQLKNESDLGIYDCILLPEIVQHFQRKDTCLLLLEYLERDPPLMNKAGMNLRIVNFFKGTMPEFRTGENRPVVDGNAEPFLGILNEGQCVQAAECNLFRAPVCVQKSSNYDFMITNCDSEGMSIKLIQSLFCVGQELPMKIVPGPSSKQGAAFVRNFIYATILRLFWSAHCSNGEALPVISFETLSRLFPANLDISVRKRMRRVAKMEVLENQQNVWRLKRNFRLLREREIAHLVSAEQYCANATRLRNEYRMKEVEQIRSALLSEKFESDKKKRNLLSIAKSKSMPWHTTKALSDAVDGRCFLTMTGEADPFSNRGFGYSFVKHSMKASNVSSKRINRAIDAAMKTILNSSSLPQKIEAIMQTDNFVNRIDPVQLSQILKVFGCTNHDVGGMLRIEEKEVMRGICMAFDEHNQSLSSADDSTDRKGKRSNSVRTAKRSRSVKSYTSYKNAFEKEKQAIFEAQLNFIYRGGSDLLRNKKKKEKNRRSIDEVFSLMKIARKYEDGRVEEIVVRNSSVIKLYTLIRSRRTQDEINEIVSDKGIKRKRTLPVVPVKVKKPRLEVSEKFAPIIDRKPKKEFTMKCGACGSIGHMRTNRACPLYAGRKKVGDAKVHTDSVTNSFSLPAPSMSSTESASKPVAHTNGIRLSKDILSLLKKETERSLVKQKKLGCLDDNLKEHETKSIVSNQNFDESSSAAIVPVAESKTPMPRVSISESNPSDVQSPRNSQKSKKPKNTPAARVNKRKQVQSVNRQKKSRIGSFTPVHSGSGQVKIRARSYHSDPATTLSIIFEKILQEVRQLPEAEPFLIPVDARSVSDYYSIVDNPMDLQTMRQRITKNHYADRQSLLMDLNLIVNNSRRYNGDEHEITRCAQIIFSRFTAAIQETEEDIMVLEAKINPLLNEDDEVALSYILERIVNEYVIRVDNSSHFRSAVSRTKYPDYYVKIKEPMHIELICTKIKQKSYKTVDHFMADIRLMHSNSLEYNGASSLLTMAAGKIVEACERCIREVFKAELGSIFQKEDDLADEDASGYSFTDLEEHLHFESSEEELETNEQLDVGMRHVNESGS